MRRGSVAIGMIACSVAVGSACDAGTGGALVMLDVQAVSTPEGVSPLGVVTTDTGWSVVLTEARLVVGSVYAFAPDPDALSILRSIVGPSIARAHGGIDPLSGRTVRAQRLDPFVLDLLDATPVDLGAAPAVAGRVDSLELRLLPPSATLTAAAHGHHAYLAGTATRGAVVVDFEGGIDIADDGTQRRVEGIPIDATFDEGGELTIEAHVASFLQGILFDTLPAADPVTGVSPLAPGSQAYEAVWLGVRNPLSYASRYVAGTGP